MKKSELIAALNMCQGDFDVEIEDPNSEHTAEITEVRNAFVQVDPLVGRTSATRDVILISGTLNHCIDTSGQ